MVNKQPKRGWWSTFVVILIMQRNHSEMPLKFQTTTVVSTCTLLFWMTIRNIAEVSPSLHPLHTHSCPILPCSVPELEVVNSKGLSTQHLTTLMQKLDNEASKLKGEVMLLELSQHVQDFLHAHNKPPFKSFYEEMMVNKQKEQEKITREEQRKMQIMKRKEEKHVSETSSYVTGLLVSEL